MPPKDVQSLPFLTRNMLAFEYATSFSLQIRSYAKRAVIIKIRGITREGVFNFSHTTTANGVFTTQNFRIPDLPIMVAVTTTDEAANTSECYTMLSLVANGDIIQELCAGTVDREKGISYPTNNSIPSRPNGGSLQLITGSDPAAGVEISQTVPPRRVWRIMSIRFRLVTSATVASRRVHLSIENPSGVILTAFSDIDQTASQTVDYSCAPYGDLSDRNDNNNTLISIPPDILISDGTNIITETTNLQAGDNFGAPLIYIEEYFGIVDIVV